jgi:hypothetical protein
VGKVDPVAPSSQSKKEMGAEWDFSYLFLISTDTKPFELFFID